MDVSENNGTPKSSILIMFSIIFTIHFGVSLFSEKNHIICEVQAIWSSNRPLRGTEMRVEKTLKSTSSAQNSSMPQKRSTAPSEQREKTACPKSRVFITPVTHV